MSSYSHPLSDVFLAPRQFFDQLVSQLISCSQSLDALERFLLEQSRELFRLLLQACLDSRSVAESPAPSVTGSDNLPRTQHRPSTRSLSSSFGTVRLSRIAYTSVSCSHRHPLDAQLRFPADSFSFHMRFRVAHTAVRCSFDETVADVLQNTSVHIGKRQAELLCVKAACDVEAFYNQRASNTNASVPEETSDSLVVLSFDGKGIPMHQADLRPDTQVKARNEHKLRHRLSSGEKRHRKRMAQVAAVYEVARFHRCKEQIVRELWPHDQPLEPRPKPQRKRVWASVAREPWQVIDEAFREARSRDPKHQREWVVLVDGSLSQLEAVQNRAKQEGISLRITYVLDVIHVLEYLWNASHAWNPAGSEEAEQWVSEKLYELLEGKAEQIAGKIRAKGKRSTVTAAGKQAIEKCVRYLEKYKTLLKYEVALSHGTPISTGVIEGTCRYLVKDRMERTGARWRLQTAEAILQLRSVWASGDWDGYCQFHLQNEFERNHLSKFHPSEHQRLAT